MTGTATDDLAAHLARFGLQQFRPGQEEVIRAVLGGEDCLCVMPTGGGKSLCYQLPAVVRPGVTLVISPLIALMKDQVDALTALDISATLINSSIAPAEQYERLERLAQGEYDLVYVAPERFRSPRFIEVVGRIEVTLLAVDEAHCISEWGHDFRRDYARIGQFRQRIGNPQTIALTATATPEVQGDVVEQLLLQRPRVLVAGFARPNLHYQVQIHPGKRNKADALIEHLRGVDGSGIIYASTRKGCEELAGQIAEVTGRRVGVYHGGMEPEQRRRCQDDFMAGRFEMVVATNAFGMGIDKADVRLVAHYNIPGTLEAYYQEAGRAGRDGDSADCLLLYSPSDRYIQEYFIESAYPSREVVAAVYEFLRTCPDDPIEITQQQLKEQLDLPIGADGVGRCEQLLEKCGVLERVEPNRNMAVVQLDSQLPTLVDLLSPQAKVRRKVIRAVENLVGDRRFEKVYFQLAGLAESLDMQAAAVSSTLRELAKLEAVDFIPPFRGRAVHMRRRDLEFDELELDFEALEQRRDAEYAKLNRVIRYAQSPGCRQWEILRYFGDDSAEPCGACDNCRSHGVRPTPTAAGDTPAADRAAPHDEALLEAVKKALSGVARAQGKFGKMVVAAMLTGSKATKVTKWNLDRLSTYGLLSHLTQDEVGQLIEGLIAAQLVEQNDVDRYRPIVQLTSRGAEVMRGQTPLDGHLPIPADLRERLVGRPAARDAAEPATTAQAEADLPPPDPDLLSALRDWRQETADAVSQPPFYVLHNTTLELLARLKPTTIDELGRIRGIGQAKLTAYAEPLLRLLAGRDPQTVEPPSAATPSTPSTTSEAADHADESIARVSDTPRPAPPPDDGQPKPSYYWTWQLLSAGYSSAQSVEIRRLSADEILDHALLAVENGLPVEPNWLLSSQQMAALDTVLPVASPHDKGQLPDELPAGIRREQAQLYLKCREIGRRGGS